MKFKCYSVLVVLIFPLLAECILNGNFVSILEMPYFAALLDYEDDSVYCGGTIISEYWVVTAAHCIDPYNDGNPMEIRTGSSSKTNTGSIHSIDEIIVHGDYESSALTLKTNDIALIKLINPIKFNKYQQPIQLSSESPKPGDNITVSGLGSQGVAKTITPVLKRTEVTMIDFEKCNEAMYPQRVTNCTFCAGDGTTDVCSGDSGGPAVFDGKIVGLVSWGPECYNHAAHDGSPGVYTSIEKYYDWIIKRTGIKY